MSKDNLNSSDQVPGIPAGQEQMLEKIKSDTERAQSLKLAKEQLQEKRKNANMRATFESQMIYDVMEKIQSGKSLNGMNNGDLSIEALKDAAKGRPN